MTPSARRRRSSATWSGTCATAPQPNKPFDPARAAADLADRLAPLAQKEAEVAANLASVPVEDHLEPQRARAARRARALADALARNRDALPPLADDARAATERLQQKFQGACRPMTWPRNWLRRWPISRPGAIGRTRTPSRPRPPRTAWRTPCGALTSPTRDSCRRRPPRGGRSGQALADPDHRDEAAAPALAEAAEAADALARRLTDRLAPGEEVAALADAERHLNRPDAPHDPAAMAETQHAIDNALARVEANAEAPAEAAEPARAAAEAVDHATELTDHAADPRRNPSREPPTPEALAEARARAAERLDALAQALPGEPPAAAPDQGEPADNPRGRAQELARQQRELAEQIGQVHEQVQQNPDKNAALAHLPEQLAPLRARQRRWPRRPGGSTTPCPWPTRRIVRSSVAEARPRCRRTAPRRRWTAATRTARRNSPARPPRTSIGSPRPCRSLPPPDPALAEMPADPALDLPPERAAQAQALARRERQIREEVQAILGERVPDQEALRDETAALGREVAELRDEAAELSNRSRNPANQAANMLGNQAPQQMRQGADQLAQGRPDPARDLQHRAAETVEAPPSSLTTSPPRSAPNCLPTPPPTGATRRAGQRPGGSASGEPAACPGPRPGPRPASHRGRRRRDATGRPGPPRRVHARPGPAPALGRVDGPGR